MAPAKAAAAAADEKAMTPTEQRMRHDQAMRNFQAF
jgi:hypothetical protein